MGWVVDGDRNTKFFHTSTIMRKRFNKIVRLQNSVGEWLKSSDLFRNHIQSGFIDLFSSSHISSIPRFCPPTLAPRVSMEESLALIAPITLSDVKLSLWSFKPFKAPSPDGLPPGFFLSEMLALSGGFCFSSGLSYLIFFFFFNINKDKYY